MVWYCAAPKISMPISRQDAARAAPGDAGRHPAHRRIEPAGHAAPRVSSGRATGTRRSPRHTARSGSERRAARRPASTTAVTDRGAIAQRRADRAGPHRRWKAPRSMRRCLRVGEMRGASRLRNIQHERTQVARGNHHRDETPRRRADAEVSASGRAGAVGARARRTIRRRVHAQRGGRAEVGEGAAGGRHGTARQVAGRAAPKRDVTRSHHAVATCGARLPLTSSTSRAPASRFRGPRQREAVHPVAEHPAGSPRSTGGTPTAAPAQG